MEVQIKSTLSEINSNNWSLGFPITAISVATLLDKTEDRRVICILKSGYSWHCALMHNGEGDYFINVSKDVRKSADLTEGQEAIFTLKPDKSEYGMPVPEELVVLWAIDPEAMEVFHRLTPGRQRTVLYYIGQPKTEATRTKRALQYMEYLKTTGGTIDFKELNLYIKNWSGV